MLWIPLIAFVRLWERHRVAETIYLHYYPASRSSSRTASAIYNTAEKEPTYEYLARAIYTTMNPGKTTFNHQPVSLPHLSTLVLI